MLNKIVAFTFGFYPLPFLVFAFYGGQHTLYRALQIVWLLLLYISYRIIPHSDKNSKEFYVISFSLLGSTIYHLAKDIISGSDINISSIYIALYYIYSMYILDKIRFLGLKEFIKPMLYIVIISLILFLNYILIVNETIYGRYLFFGLHPNLGGEFFFVAMIISCYIHKWYMRLFVAIMIIISLVLLESRAALLGVIIILYYREVHFVLFNKKSDKSISKNIGITLVVIIFLIFAYINIDYIINDVLKVNDKARGIDTGLVGRVDRTLLAIPYFLENLFFGIGLEAYERRVNISSPHNGFFSLVLELGIVFSFPIILLMGKSLLINDKQKVVFLLASYIVYFFSDRSINMNIFPFVMWILLLPWENNNKIIIRMKTYEHSKIYI